ncbi:hypothetical protein R1flu_007976 [Riccia fluitans]|uniref:Endonuclease/exonuclease/phosphatase domain-containing protein n=1 Tax=Riccia fluitans TaxID=41844 RepID=A0ABD1YAQ2_9MARC
MNHNTQDVQVPSRLVITSWNVRGLNDQERKLKVKDFVRKEKPLILALQETKLTNNKMKLAASSIMPSYSFIASQGRGGGGTTLFFHPTISVRESGRLSDGNLTWAREDFQGHSLHIAVVYSPHTPGLRAQFWKRLNQLLPFWKWILVGDWNIVERPEQTSGFRNHMAGVEETNFRSLKHNSRSLMPSTWSRKEVDCATLVTSPTVQNSVGRPWIGFTYLLTLPGLKP